MFLSWAVIDEAAVANVVLWLAGFCKDQRTRDTAYSHEGNKQEQLVGKRPCKYFIGARYSVAGTYRSPV